MYKSPLKEEELVRVHITIPKYLHEAVKQSAENTDRSYSKMITSILRGIYKS